MKTKNPQTLLRQWYLQKRRPLPWREDRNPYLIWISEVMLQQTTVQAVIPFFERFKKRFPNLQSLAAAPESDVLEHWAGLGYYSRARNLHKAAQALVKLNEFPRTYQELLQLPGLGDYTARALSSIAFDESVGVVDGNVIRILSRLTGKQFLWWTTSDKKILQELADQMCQGESASVVNQAMMELGATVCTPKSPSCALCPWLGLCQAQRQGTIAVLPVKRAKSERRLVALKFKLFTHNNEVALSAVHDLPFLKDTLLPPLSFKVLKEKPKNYDFQHSITCYQIFVTVETKSLRRKDPQLQWFPAATLSKVNPSSILKKTISTIPSLAKRY